MYYLDIDPKNKKAFCLLLIRHVVRQAFIYLKQWEYNIINHSEENAQNLMDKSLTTLQEKSRMRVYFPSWDKVSIDGQGLRSVKPSILSRIFNLITNTPSCEDQPRYLLHNDNTKEPLLKRD